MTQGDFKSFMETLEAQHLSTVKREMEYVMWTGESGMKHFDLEMRRAPVRTDYENAIAKGLLDPQERERISEMIESDDTSNIKMAGAILDFKLHPNSEEVWQ